MSIPISEKHTNALLLILLNLLSDYDGHISEKSMRILDELRKRSDPVPPLYLDVFRLPFSATCTELVNRLEQLSQQQIAIASYAFQIFRSYEQMLRVDTSEMAPAQRAASEAQMDKIRQVIARTRSTLASEL